MSKTTTKAAMGQAEFTTPTLPISKITADATSDVRMFKESRASLQELSDSIKRNGVLEPILVVPGKNGQYLAIAGRRRLAAAKKAGLKEVPVKLADAETPEQRLEVSATENIQRKQLSPMEMALTFKAMRKMHGLQDAKGTAKLAIKLGVSRAKIITHEKLLTLPKEVQEKVHEGYFQAQTGLDFADVLEKYGKKELTKAVAAVEKVTEEKKEKKAKAAKPKKEKKAKGEKVAAKAPSKEVRATVQESRRAMREAGVSPGSRQRTISDLSTFLEMMDSVDEADGTRAVAKAILSWISGQMTDAKLSTVFQGISVEGGKKAAPVAKKKKKDEDDDIPF